MPPVSSLLAFICVFAYLTGPCLCAPKTVNRMLKTPFTGVSVDGPFGVEVIFGDAEMIALTGEDLVLQAITTRVTPDGTLDIRFKSTAPIRSPGNVQIRVTAKSINRLVTSSNSQIVMQTAFTAKNTFTVASYESSQIILQGKITTGSFSAKVSTSSNLVAAVAAEDVNVVTNGASAVTLTGTAANANVAISGSSQFHGRQFAVQFYTASVTGKATGKFNAVKELKVSVSQDGTAIALGPAKVFKEVRGHGSVLRQ